jgi:hypothetical protein
MKKLMIFIAVLCFLVFSTVIGQEAKEEEKPDPLANFSLVDETQPVPEDVKVGFESITRKDAVTYLKFISDDLLEGRDTGSDGYDIAALYVATMFELWGLKPAGDKIQPRMDFRRMMMEGQTARSSKRSYFQNIAMRETLERDGKAVAEWQKGQQKKTRSFHPNVDYSYFASGSQSLTAPVVFVGYGIQEKSLKFDEYKNLDVKGKFVMMLSEAPGKDDPDSPFNKGELKKKYYPQRRRMRRMTNPKTKLATDLGAVGVLVVENSPQDNPGVARQALDRQKIYDDKPIIPGERRRVSLMEGRGLRMPWDSVATIRVSREMANQILGFVDQDVDTLKGKIEKTLQPQSMPLTSVTFTVKSTAKTKLINSMNVLGYIEGSDPELKKEAIVIGAHLDHLGMRGDYIYNGADDNGSGSAGVMEIAEAFTKNPVKPKRSIVFALWTGEEKGLLGSRHYVGHPFIEKTYCTLNLDMISRVYDKSRIGMMARIFGENIPKEALDKIDAKKFVSLSYDADTPELGTIIRENNNYVGLHLSMRASSEGMGGSDHAPFAMNNIPWAFFIAAMTEDYHQPTDSVEKASPKLMEKIIRITYLTAFSLANN